MSPLAFIARTPVARWWTLALCIAVVLGRSDAATGQPALDSVQVGSSVEQVASRYQGAVIAFYRQRAYRPVWTNSTGLSEHGQQLRSAVAEVDADGLDPRVYLQPAHPLGETQEEVEVALAERLLRVAEDLTRGRVAPSSVYDDWAASRRELDYGWVLQQAASESPAATLQAARPPHEAYARLRRALARYRALAEAGGWPAVPPGPVLRLGDEDASVSLLRERLRISRDLAEAPSAESVQRYDATLEQAVRRAQARYGLEVDGVVGPATRAALNVPAAERARQIALNMERWRWLPADLGATYLHINAAGMWLDLVEDGERVERLRVIVGTRRTPTPGFASRITHVVLNPYWHVPESIARAEIWPEVARNPNYLARHHMRVLPNGQIRQDPGPDNPLGPVKFIFGNPFGVRLHGTSAPALFDRPVRAFSHGCIRVEEPLRVAERLLQGTPWDATRIQTVLSGRSEQWVVLPTSVPLYVAYWTVWVEDDGTIQFRDDLYGRDLALAVALGWTDGSAWTKPTLALIQWAGTRAVCGGVAP